MRTLLNGGETTIAELARSTKLSRQTTTQVVDDLVASGFVEILQAGPPGGMGRPAQRVVLKTSAGNVLGVDVGAHKILVLVGDLFGNIVSKARRTVTPADLPADRLSVTNDCITEALARCPGGQPRITQAGVATVGSVEPDGNVIYCKAIRDWEGQNPARAVSEAFGFPAYGFTDMNMSVLAEHWRGAARDATNVVYLHAGRRLGMALLVGGVPLRGHHSAAGQIGIWRQLSWKEDYEDLMNPVGGAEAVFAAAAAGDLGAKARIASFVADMCQGVAPVVVAFDPELLVLGGGISAAGNQIAEPLRTGMQVETEFAPNVVCSTLGDEAVALGALREALDRAKSGIFDELAMPSVG
ncbi:MAG TPA: ROK family transcriptional regulator [Devosia sp.]|jgi:predicted NBD/HSP70 family sugar kinase|uniref:ROK family transcriptional regulator n=1 Tax=Devosia sp. TaxID=1871048 RepID=UPI002DDD17E4|nr:ROK family transcriptional regulator [Devosia sp.]HEV2514264.1 ROK family transcriptional regulator [Devosia sp.]